jgi:hypothetical protein
MMPNLSNLTLQIYGAVPLEGTVQLSDIARMTKIKYNVVSYHIAKLRELKLVTSFPRAATQAPMDLYRTLPPKKNMRKMLEHQMLYGEIV